MNSKFKVEFILFDKNTLLTESDITQKNKLIHEDMKYVLNLAINKLLPGAYKLNETPELSISSSYSNQNKLYMDFDIENNENQHSIFFYTVDNINLYYFEELKKIVKKIRKEIEKYLNKKIGIYISMEMNDINSDSDEKINQSSILSHISNVNYII
jgi:hypothetical protein